MGFMRYITSYKYSFIDLTFSCYIAITISATGSWWPLLLTIPLVIISTLAEDYFKNNSDRG